MATNMQEQLNDIIQMIEETLSLVQSRSKSDTNAALAGIKNAILVMNNICKQETNRNNNNLLGETVEAMLINLDEAVRASEHGGDITMYCEKICQQADFIKDSLNKPNKRTALFLPYKASMWDSLESIWLAAKDDPQCEAIVMPIPYCDRNPDGSVAKWHYEGAEFPDYVPITDFRSYDIAEHKPDEIYIHNPYDDYNKVTSVHPAFYSDELKKHTNMLVYVPYFVTDGVSVGEHFCKTPGVLNADIVIVENEIIKKQYIQYYPNPNATAEYLDKKFLPLGSPKIDKVKRSRREDFTLPQEWQEQLIGKKAVLYNTHLNGILSNPQAFINKLHYVFETFKNRDDVVLWWRPHPLIKATVQSMQPAVGKAYNEIENMYKQQNIGIFDDTTDLHRAICWTDAYYGDMSSVVWLYKATGKPVLIQQILYLNNIRHIGFYNLVKYGEGYYFVDYYHGIIGKIDIVSGKIGVECQIPDKYLSGPYGYGTIGNIGDKFFVLPMYEKNILEFDIIKKQFNSTVLLNGNRWKYMSAILNSVNYKNKYYFIPVQAHEIIVYDFETKQYKRITEWFDLLQDCGNLQINDKSNLLANSCTCNGKLYIAVMQGNYIVEINMETDCCKIYQVGDDKNRYQGIAYDGKKFWLLSCTNEYVTTWCMETGETKGILLADISCLEEPYVNIIYFSGEIILFPNNEHNLVYINVKSGTVKKGEFNEGRVLVGKVIDDSEYYWLEIGDDCSSSNLYNNLYIHSGEIVHKFKLSGAYIEKDLTSNKYEQGEILYEDQGYNINNLIDSERMYKGKVRNCIQIYR